MGVKNTDDNRNTKKPFVYYYLIVLLVVFLLNAFLFPSMMERAVMEVLRGGSLGSKLTLAIRN